jgi:uncharacterized protein YsxB (DUF464 family)
VIRVTVTTDAKGVLEKVTATGHSLEFPRGENIVCAAATVLLRTAVRLLEREKGLQISSNARSRGEVEFKVKLIDKKISERVRAVGDYLKQGIADLEREFPGECALTTVEKGRR